MLIFISILVVAVVFLNSWKLSLEWIKSPDSKSTAVSDRSVPEARENIMKWLQAQEFYINDK